MYHYERIFSEFAIFGNGSLTKLAMSDSAKLISHFFSIPGQHPKNTRSPQKLRPNKACELLYLALEQDNNTNYLDSDSALY
jgi:hypothetical protein